MQGILVEWVAVVSYIFKEKGGGYNAFSSVNRFACISVECEDGTLVSSFQSLRYRRSRRSRRSD